jgi:vacuolar iron transporter family protein
MILAVRIVIYMRDCVKCLLLIFHFLITNMKQSLKIGICFGVTSGIITTLGLLVGLSSGTNSQSIVIGGVLMIAIADAFSDALGIHVSEESDKTKTEREIWESTISTFLAKFFFALTFVVPVLIFSLRTAVLIDICWGFFALSLLSFILAREQGESAFKAILEHLGIAIVVIISTYYVGNWISHVFGM